MKHARKPTKLQDELSAVDATLAEHAAEDNRRRRIEAYWRSRGVDPHARLVPISIDCGGNHQERMLVVRSDLVMRVPT